MQSTLALRGIQAPRPTVSPTTRGAFHLAAYFIPTMGHLIFLTCLAVILAVAPKFLSSDGDAGRHLTVGEYMLASRTFLDHDVFSFTMAGQPFVPYEWLAETSSALTYHVAGLAGPVLLHAAAIALSCSLLYGHLRRRGHALLLALAVAVYAGATSAIHWLARPHVFTFLGTVLFVRLLDDWYSGRSSRRSLWLLVPITLLWVNAHGGFLVGLIVLGAYVGSDVLRAALASGDAAAAARRRLRDVAPPAAAALGATLLNPAGPLLYAHVTGYFGKKLLVDRTQEYMSTDFHSPDSVLFMGLILLLVVSLAWSRRRLALHEGLLCAGFTYFALHSARNIPLFAFVTAPVLASQLGALPMPPFGDRLARVAQAFGAWVGRRNAAYSRIESRSRGQLLPVLALTALTAVAFNQTSVGEAPLGARFDPARQPVAGVEYLKANPIPGHGFNELRWGGYLLHAMWPQNQVFIDGQTDFYGVPLSREFLDVVEQEPGWQQVLDRHQIQWVLLDTGSPAVRALANDPAWRVAYFDKTATILRRVA